MAITFTVPALTKIRDEKYLTSLRRELNMWAEGTYWMRRRRGCTPAQALRYASRMWLADYIQLKEADVALAVAKGKAITIGAQLPTWDAYASVLASFVGDTPPDCPPLPSLGDARKQQRGRLDKTSRVTALKIIRDVLPCAQNVKNMHELVRLVAKKNMFAQTTIKSVILYWTTFEELHYLRCWAYAKEQHDKVWRCVIWPEILGLMSMQMHSYKSYHDLCKTVDELIGFHGSTKNFANKYATPQQIVLIREHFPEVMIGLAQRKADG